MRRTLTIIGSAVAFLTIALGGIGICACAAHAAPRPPVIVVVRGGGFHWGDAAIGASAGLSVALAVFGATLTLTGSRKRSTGGTRHG